MVIHYSSMYCILLISDPVAHHVQLSRRFMLEDLPEEMSFLPPGQPAPVGPQPRRLFVVKVGWHAIAGTYEYVGRYSRSMIPEQLLIVHST